MQAFLPLILTLCGIILLLYLVLRVKLPAFLALLAVSLGLGLILSVQTTETGSLTMDSLGVIKAMQDGMGGTLGFVAIVVGLGAMFGALLEAAGGVLKQVLIHSGVGADLAQLMQSWSVPVLVFGFAVAALMRVAQGSATVAMLTAAGLTAPLLTGANLPPQQIALIVIADLRRGGL